MLLEPLASERSRLLELGALGTAACAPRIADLETGADVNGRTKFTVL